MAALIDFTTYDDVRSVLGVSIEELPDETLALDLYYQSLLLQLDDISASVATNYASISAIAPGSRTTTQKSFYAVTRLFSTYAIATTSLSALTLFAPRQITDGKAAIDRQVDVFQDVKDGVRNGFNALRKRLLAALAAVDLTYTAPALTLVTFATFSGTATDPVTNT